MRLKDISDETFIDAFEASSTITEFVLLLGYRPYGGSWMKIKNRALALGLPYEEKAAKARSKGLSHRFTVNDEDLFVENGRTERTSIRRRLLRDKLIEYVCQICDQEPWWNGKPLTLILDHINGVNNDHRLENLRWVCGNCNMQLTTFGSRNKN
jgi:hypothetical protein